MEKQILIPIIVVLGLLTCGIGIYLYIRCRNKPVEALQQIVIDEQINKPVETSVDNTTNVCDNNTIPVGDDVVVEEKKEDITDLVLEYQSNLIQETERQLAFIDNELQILGEMRAGCAEMRAGCAEIVEAGNGFIQAGNGFIKQCDITKAGMIKTRKTIADIKSINRFEIAYHEAAVKNAERNLNTRT